VRRISVSVLTGSDLLYCSRQSLEILLVRVLGFGYSDLRKAGSVAKYLCNEEGMANVATEPVIA